MLVGFVALLLVGAVVAATVGGYFDRTTRTTVVTGKERVCESGNSSCKYLVYTESGTYRLQDSIFIGRFDTSDVYGQIDEDTCYEITSYGWRVPFFSTYPNIEDIEERPAAECSGGER
jgi:hypothetical protein